MAGIIIWIIVIVFIFVKAANSNQKNTKPQAQTQSQPQTQTQYRTQAQTQSQPQTQTQYRTQAQTKVQPQIKTQQHSSSIIERAKENVNVSSAEINFEGENLIGKVEDLIVMGYSGNLSFERDFLGEGMDMINRYVV